MTRSRNRIQGVQLDVNVNYKTVRSYNLRRIRSRPRIPSLSFQLTLAGQPRRL